MIITDISRFKAGDKVYIKDAPEYDGTILNISGSDRLLVELTWNKDGQLHSRSSKYYQAQFHHNHLGYYVKRSPKIIVVKRTSDV